MIGQTNKQTDRRKEITTLYIKIKLMNRLIRISFIIIFIHLVHVGIRKKCTIMNYNVHVDI